MCFFGEEPLPFLQISLLRVLLVKLYGYPISSRCFFNSLASSLNVPFEDFVLRSPSPSPLTKPFFRKITHKGDGDKHCEAMHFKSFDLTVSYVATYIFITILSLENVCCNIRNVKSNYLKCIASQCLSPPCVLFFLWTFDGLRTRIYDKAFLYSWWMARSSEERALECFCWFEVGSHVENWLFIESQMTV